MSEPLLGVDLEAALRKLALGRLPGLQHAPVALVRTAMAGGPARVWLDIGRRSVRLRHDGRPPPAEALRRLGVALSPALADPLRQQALEELEEAGLLDLVVAFALPADRVRLVAGAPVALELERQAGRLRVGSARTDAALELEVVGLRVETRGWAEVAREHLAHARREVWLDGRRIDRGLALTDVLAPRVLTRGELTAVVGLPLRGHAARTRVLERGILRREQWSSPADGRVWDALVDGPPGQVNQALALAADGAREALAEAVRGSDELGEAELARLAHLLFRLADGGLGAQALAGAAVFWTLDGRRLRAEELAGLAEDRVLRALGPGERPERFRLRGTVLRLGEEERAFVERHLGLRVREPARAARPPGRLARVRQRLGAWWRRTLRLTRLAALERLAVPAEELRPAETVLVRALEAALAEGLLPRRGAARIRVCRQRLFARWAWDEAGREILFLGRLNPTLQRLAGAVARDARNLYPALMLLEEGADAFGHQRELAARRLAGLGEVGR